MDPMGNSVRERNEGAGKHGALIFWFGLRVINRAGAPSAFWWSHGKNRIQCNERVKQMMGRSRWSERIAMHSGAFWRGVWPYRQKCNWFRWPYHNGIRERRINQMVPRAKWSIVPTSVKFSRHWLAVSGCITSGWWFGTWLLFSINIGNLIILIIPTDELHDFSEGLVYHQPEIVYK